MLHMKPYILNGETISVTKLITLHVNCNDERMLCDMSHRELEAV